MSRPVSCNLCGGEVDDADMVEMPNGAICLRCYEWLEEMIEDADIEEIEILEEYDPFDDDEEGEDDTDFNHGL